MRNRAPNRVRQLRETRGLSQLALAAAARLTRQSVGAIEAGRATPAVDVALRIASALDCRVEDLFASAPAEASIATEPSAPPTLGRVAVAHVAGRWVSYPLDGDAHGIGTSADGIATRIRRGRLEVEATRASSEFRDNLVMMGCAGALGLLADRLNTRPGHAGRCLWFARSSSVSLEALAHSRTHVAGVHLVDPKSGEPNVADVRRLGGSKPVVLITLGRWEAGLVTAPGNPKKLRSVADFGRRGLHWAVRESGSGARRLLDRELRRAGLASELANGARLQLAGHREVAQAVAMGAADVGVATRDVAIALGLGFVPLAEERYDLALPLTSLADPRIQRMCDTLATSAFRRELVALGYDVRDCGERAAEIHAA